MANLEQSLEMQRGGIDAFVTKGKEENTLVQGGADQLYRVLVEAVHDGTATLDSAGSILYANKRFAEILGLPVERHAGMRDRMRQLAGTLEIASRPGRRTRVIATLPRAKKHSMASAPLLNSAAEAPQAEQAVQVENKPPRRHHARKRILIADDHEMLRRGVRTMLESETDWEVCGEAVDGKDAIEKVVALSPDLVILDINMPILNGLAAARQILRDQPRTKILVFTVHESDQTLKEIQASGAHGYLPKSRAGQDLLRMAREILEGKNVSVFAATASPS